MVFMFNLNLGGVVQRLSLEDLLGRSKVGHVEINMLGDRAGGGVQWYLCEVKRENVASTIAKDNQGHPGYCEGENRMFGEGDSLGLIQVPKSIETLKQTVKKNSR